MSEKYFGNTIDSVEEPDSKNPNDDTILALNKELKDVLERLAVDGGNEGQLNELKRKRSVLQQQIIVKVRLLQLQQSQEQLVVHLHLTHYQVMVL